MAIVLPQGRFNNASEQRVREFIVERCRILAVVGLHPNSFKPHTGTRTSVLFVQKWNDDGAAGPLCPIVEDYEIFFATQRVESVNNSGQKVYVREADGAPKRDAHGHFIVAHDLFNHEGLTRDGIAEAFAEFAKKGSRSFFPLGPFDCARFAALSEGLEIAVVNLSGLNDELRFNSQFFQKRYLAEDRALSKKITKPIGSVAFVTDGPHGYHEVDEKSRVAMLTAKCAANWFAKRDGAETVADWVRVANRRSYLEEGDLILSTRGTVGNCAVVVAECLPAIIDQDVARISLYAGCEFSPQYLLSYLNSRFGQDHIQRFASGMVQQGLPLAKLWEIPVPCIWRSFNVQSRRPSFGHWSSVAFQAQVDQARRVFFYARAG